MLEYYYVRGVLKSVALRKVHWPVERFAKASQRSERLYRLWKTTKARGGSCPKKLNTSRRKRGAGAQFGEDTQHLPVSEGRSRSETIL
jgi:hypothetical protein